MRVPGILCKNFQIMIFILIGKLIVSIVRNFVLSFEQLIRQLELLKYCIILTSEEQHPKSQVEKIENIRHSQEQFLVTSLNIRLDLLSP